MGTYSASSEQKANDTASDQANAMKTLSLNQQHRHHGWANLSRFYVCGVLARLLLLVAAAGCSGAKNINPGQTANLDSDYQGESAKPSAAREG